MSAEENTCPKCNSSYAYFDGTLWNCPECSHEWIAAAEAGDSEYSAQFVDAYGAPLQDGGTVTIIKDLKAGKETIKSGTKVKSIRLLDEPVNGHDISCKIAGHGSIYLKCSVVKKA
nr:zinc ribbon domain-containing protein YjdM [uncultured Desulfobulbus sp.]